ncbi:hypothetical protein WJX84_011420 [Apatococcus fuscideae]|uniref:Uncharacterized protein n=1 Tax=Apatococcus fuscideae TaxID=2026836 RepID=A0AAW1T2D7_9CHLO
MAAQALVPQEGLSSSMQSYIERLDWRLLKVTENLFSSISAGDLGSAGQLKGMPELASSIGKQDALSNLLRYLQVAASHQREVSHLQSEQQILQAAKTLERTYHDSQNAVATGDYTSAAQHIPAVIAAEEAITALSAGRYVFPNVLGSMQEGLKQAARSWLTVDTQHQQIMLRPAVAGAWRALQLRGQAHAVLQEAAGDLQNNLIAPMIMRASRAMVFWQPSLKTDQAAMLLRWSDRPASKETQAVGDSCLVPALILLLEVLADQGLGRGTALALEFGKLLWPPLAASYMQEELGTAGQAPATSSSQAFQAHASRGIVLENAAVALGFLQRSPTGSSQHLPIQAAVLKTQDKLLHGRRLALLADARAIILEPTFDPILIDAPFEAPDAAADTPLLAKGPYQDVHLGSL